MKIKSYLFHAFLLALITAISTHFSPARAQSYDLSANVYIGAPPLTVSFDVMGGSYGGGNEYQYNFGDGLNDSSFSPFDSHTYTNSGTYYPQVLISPSGGFGYSSQIFVAPVNSFSFTTNNDGSLNISSYTGSGGAVTIPDTTNGQPITSIGAGAFETIGGTYLSTITISTNITSIGDYAFSQCRNLFAANIPNSVTNIGVQAFYQCQYLTSIVIPNSVINIGNQAFYQCYWATNAIIGTNTVSLGDGIFAECFSLNSIAVDPNNPAYSSVSGVLFNKNQTKLIAYPSGNSATSYSIPSSVTNIGDYAFDSGAGNGSKLTSIIIPSSVNTIGLQAFEYCTSLTNFTIPNSVTSLGDFAFIYCNNLTNVIIGNSVTNIGTGEFEGCYNLMSVTIPNSVTKIGFYSFYGCQLTSVSIPNSVTYIDQWAFNGCSSLTSILIPNSVTHLGYGAFVNCTSLTNVTIETGITNIGSTAFSSCRALKGIYFYGNSPTPTNDTSVFSGDSSSPIAYYSPTATGWGATFDGIPTATWTPPVVIATNSIILSASTAGFSQSGGGSFKFGFTSTPGASFTIFGSSNLTLPFGQWINLGAAVESPPGSGQFTFADPSVTNNPSYYYRVRSP